MTEKTGASPSRVLFAVAMVVAAVALTAWAIAARTGDDPGTRPTGGSVIEEYPPADRAQGTPFRADLLSGGRLDSRDLIGEVVVYNMWGSWCAPCVKEAPELVEAAREYDGRVPFVGINVRDNDAAARAFERDHKVPYDSVTSADADKAMLAFQGSLAAAAVPATLVVDRDGRVAARVVGPVTAATLRALIEPVLD